MTLANERGVEGRGAQWANTGGQAQIKKVCFHTLSVNSHQRCDFTLNSIAVKVWFHTLSVNSHHWCDFTLFTQFFRKCDFTLWVWNHTQSVISHFLTYFTPRQRCRVLVFEQPGIKYIKITNIVNAAPFDALKATHCPPQTILGKQGALQKFFGEILGMNFCSSNALLKLKNNALFTRWNLFCDFFMWFFLWFCKSVLVKMLPQNIQFLTILKPLVFSGEQCGG